MDLTSKYLQSSKPTNNDLTTQTEPVYTEPLQEGMSSTDSVTGTKMAFSLSGM